VLATALEPSAPAAQRLAAVAATTDGFALSELDLEVRREGDVLGTDQSGVRSSLRMLQVLRDEDVILAAREEATALVSDDPDLARHPALRAAVETLLDAERAAYLEKA
jgi:ATP-dependent DNA helicase RecG